MTVSRIFRYSVSRVEVAILFSQSRAPGIENERMWLIPPLPVAASARTYGQRKGSLAGVGFQLVEIVSCLLPMSMMKNF
jgi:hypothetical protein